MKISTTSMRMRTKTSMRTKSSMTSMKMKIWTTRNSRKINRKLSRRNRMLKGFTTKDMADDLDAIMEKLLRMFKEKFGAELR